LHLDARPALLHRLRNGQVGILDEGLLEENDLLVELADLALDDLLEDLGRLLGVLGIVLEARERDFPLLGDEGRVDVLPPQRLWWAEDDAHAEVLAELDDLLVRERAARERDHRRLLVVEVEIVSDGVRLETRE